MIPRNRLAVIKNRSQLHFQRVLCVCSAGVLRSPTAAWLLSQEPYNFNTRSCGNEHYALIPLTEELVVWADEIVVMDDYIQADVNRIIALAYHPEESHPLVHNLNIEDDFDYRDPNLVQVMQDKFRQIFF